MRLVANVIRQVQSFQKESYTFHKVPVIYNYFANTPDYLDDDDAFDRSRMLLPKKDRMQFDLQRQRSKSRSDSYASSKKHKRKFP
mmetsp:Transcript_29966/g.33445  ORF Transcript_29966/g.33445 Transcript_29966/m.33445 type:complete len:85 (-) Transcript_29966:733-987(-)